MSFDILGTSWDQCVSMVHYCFTSTQTIRLVRTESPGRPPQFSHSSWTLMDCHVRGPTYIYTSICKSLAVCEWCHVSVLQSRTRWIHSLSAASHTQAQDPTGSLHAIVSSVEWSFRKGKSPRWCTVRKTTCCTNTPRSCLCHSICRGELIHS